MTHMTRTLVSCALVAALATVAIAAEAQAAA